ncbi:reverse transcriptase domain, reverse transcriptase zinc-binding domain protein, partial [Tanacetum coccineum]
MSDHLRHMLGLLGLGETSLLENLTFLGISATDVGRASSTYVTLDNITVISDRFANTTYGFLLGKRVTYPVVANYVRNIRGKYGLVRSMFSSSTRLFYFQFSSMDGLDAMLENGPWSNYARAMIELHADMELKDNIVVAIPKITREGHYTCNIRVEYEWKPPRCASCKVFGHNHEECLKNVGAGETKNLKKTSQAPKGIAVGPKLGFKPTKEYKPAPKKHTTNSSGNKKKGVDSTNK